MRRRQRRMYWVRYRGETTRVRSESCISVDDLRYEVQRALWRAMGRFDISDLTVSYPAGTALQNDTRLAELARRAGADSHDALVVTVNAAAEAGAAGARGAGAPSMHVHGARRSRRVRRWDAWDTSSRDMAEYYAVERHMYYHRRNGNRTPPTTLPRDDYVPSRDRRAGDFYDARGADYGMLRRLADGLGTAVTKGDAAADGNVSDSSTTACVGGSPSSTVPALGASPSPPRSRSPVEGFAFLAGPAAKPAARPTEQHRHVGNLGWDMLQRLSPEDRKAAEEALYFPAAAGQHGGMMASARPQRC